MAEPRYKSLEELCELAEFVIEANSFEQMTLWQEYNTKLDWQECTRGWSQQIGTIDGRPIQVTFMGAKLNEHHVMFYDPTSQVVDHVQIEAWLKKNCNPKYDGTRRAHCDANNFHQCYHFVTGKKVEAPNALKVWMGKVDDGKLDTKRVSRFMP